MDEQYPDDIRAERHIATLLHEAAIARKHGWTKLAAELEQRRLDLIAADHETR